MRILPKKIYFVLLIAVVFPTAIFASTLNPLLYKEGVGGGLVPTRMDPKEIESEIGAKAYVVIDRTSGNILTMKQENLVWPIASLTKLMTADIVLQKKIPSKKLQHVLKEDDVGGAKLYVKNGDKFSVDDLFYAMLSGSANNAANALARTSSSSRKEFVRQMNTRAKIIGLDHTTYVDTSGMELGNTSTVLDIAKLADKLFRDPSVKRYTTTAKRNIRVANTGVYKKITSTNWMLFKPAYDDVWVTGGKTGFLDEAGWNLAVALRSSSKDTKRELLLVLFGSPSRSESFQDAEKLAKWAWEVYEWK